MRPAPLTLVVAADEAMGIGRDGVLPFRLPRDMAHFRRVTSAAPAGKQNAVIMGRKTYESIPARFRPLVGRLNVVLTRSQDYAAAEGVILAASLDAAAAALDARDDVATRFVIGGGQVYREALSRPETERVLLTRVHTRCRCDTHLPALDGTFERVASDGPHDDDGVPITFETYIRAARADAAP